MSREKAISRDVPLSRKTVQIELVSERDRYNSWLSVIFVMMHQLRGTSLADLIKTLKTLLYFGIFYSIWSVFNRRYHHNYFRHQYLSCQIVFLRNHFVNLNLRLTGLENTTTFLNVQSHKKLFLKQKTEIGLTPFILTFISISAHFC